MTNSMRSGYNVENDKFRFILEDVKYVPGLRRSLISLGTLEKEDYTVKMQMGRIKRSKKVGFNNLVIKQVGFNNWSWCRKGKWGTEDIKVHRVKDEKSCFGWRLEPARELQGSVKLRVFQVVTIRCASGS
ncbi:hypothetical protein Tco_0033437 [Tanacetum coccineum]